MREVRRQGEIAEGREAVRLDGVVGERGERAGESAANAPPAPALSAALRVNAMVIESQASWFGMARDLPRFSAHC